MCDCMCTAVVGEWGAGVSSKLVLVEVLQATYQIDTGVGLLTEALPVIYHTHILLCVKGQDRAALCENMSTPEGNSMLVPIPSIAIMTL